MESLKLEKCPWCSSYRDMTSKTEETERMFLEHLAQEHDLIP